MIPYKYIIVTIIILGDSTMQIRCLASSEKNIFSYQVAKMPAYLERQTIFQNLYGLHTTST